MLRPGRGGAQERAAGSQAAGPGEQASAAAPRVAGPSALARARVNRPWAVFAGPRKLIAGSGRNGQINSKVTVFDFLIFQKTV